MSHGTKFAPVTRGKYIDAKKSTDEFTRKLKIKFAFHNTDFEDTSLCRNKSDKSKELQNENNVVIKEADKGDALVIMDRDFYENKLVITFMMLQHT